MDDYKTHIGGKDGSKFNYQIKKINGDYVVAMHVLASVHTKLPLHLHVARLKENPIDAVLMGLVDLTQCGAIKFLTDSEIVLYLDRGYHLNGTAMTLAENGVEVFGPVCKAGKLNYAEIYDDGEEPPPVEKKNGQIAWKRQGHDCAAGGRQDLGKNTSRQAVVTRKHNRSVVICGPPKEFKLGQYVYRLGTAIRRVLLKPPTTAGLGDAIQAAFREHGSGAVEVTEGQNICRAWSTLRKWGVTASGFSQLHSVIATRAAAEYGDYKGLHGVELEEYEAACKLHFAVVGKDAVDSSGRSSFVTRCQGKHVPQTRENDLAATAHAKCVGSHSVYHTLPGEACAPNP